MPERTPLFEERLKRCTDVIERRIPDRVPVWPIIEQWAHQTFNISIRKSYMTEPMQSVEAYRRTYEHVYVDCTYGDGNLKPLNMIDLFGEGIYVVNDNGVQIKGGHGRVMNDDEYPLLAADPWKFLKNVIIPRKYPIVLENTPEQNAELMAQAVMAFAGFAQSSVMVNEAIEHDLEVPVLTKGGGITAPDFIFDYLRDFAGVATDIRRRKKEFCDACEALTPIVVSFLCASPDPSGLTFIPQHMPTYVRPKLFEEVYFPYWAKVIDELHKAGRTPCFYSENNWMPYLDYFQDLPDNGQTMCIFEAGDLKEIKDRVGKYVIIGGGMHVDKLMLGTVDECIDEAKWCLDNLAPGGNYMFCLDKNLLNAGDAKLENLAAVTHYVHENGKY